MVFYYMGANLLLEGPSFYDVHIQLKVSFLGWNFYYPYLFKLSWFLVEHTLVFIVTYAQLMTEPKIPPETYLWYYL